MKVTFENVSRSFAEVQAVREVSISVEDGDLFFLLGPSGCGKTTLLRIAAGLESPDAGKILFDGENVTSVPADKRKTAMVFQGYALWPHMTVAENVSFGLENMGLPKKKRASRVANALAQVKIENLAERKPNELSGGQQQRVALARTLVVEPACLLMDEPLANLDAKLRRKMRDEIRKLCKNNGLTAIYVTHDRREALSMADQIAVMDNGRILQTGPPKAIYTRPDTRFVADFISETNFVQGRIETIERDRTSIHTPLGILVSSIPGDGLSVGDSVELSLRPEAVRIIPEEVDHSRNNLFQMTVDDSVYLGEMNEYTLVSDNSLMLKTLQLNPEKIYTPGTVLSLVIDPQDVVIMQKTDNT